MSEGKATQQCVLTGFYFKPRKPDERVSPEAREILKETFQEMLTTDANFRESVMTAILHDDTLATSLAQTIMSVKAKDAGLMTSGSLADLFRKQTKKTGKRKTSKDT